MRKVSYYDTYVTIRKDGRPAQLHVSRETSDIVDPLTMLTDDIERSREDKSECFIAFLGLKYYTDIIINDLYRMGYDLCQVGKKDLHVRQYRLRQSPNGETYYIQIKTGYKCYVTYQAVDPVIGLKQLPTNDEEARHALELYHYTRDTFLKGTQRSETRVLYSSASISRTMLMRQYPGLWELTQRLRKKTLYDEKGNGYRANTYIEKFCRPGIHGGINFVSAKGYTYKGSGIVLDANSLYPWVSADAYIPLPDVVRHEFKEPPVDFVTRPGRYYTIMKVEVSATLKDDGIECICPDGNTHVGHPHYLAEMKRRVLTLTPSDRKMLFENYNITYYRIREYITFVSKKGYFKKYVSPIYEQKRTSEDIIRDFVKLLLNGFIGTFARQVFSTEYQYEIQDGYIIPHKVPKSPEDMKKEYGRVSGLAFINMAIVSEAKLRMVRVIKKHMDRFLYTDTDSVHMSGEDIPHDMPVSDKLGDFKVEHRFTKCTYKQIKSYMLVEDGKIVQCVSGIPKDMLSTMPDKCPGVDISYLRKAVKHQHIDALYEKPVPVWRMDIDVAEGTLVMHCDKGYLKRLEKTARRQTWQERVDEEKRTEDLFKEIREEGRRGAQKIAQERGRDFAYEGWLRVFREGRPDQFWIDLNPWQKAYVEEHRLELERDSCLFY